MRKLGTLLALLFCTVLLHAQTPSVLRITGTGTIGKLDTLYLDGPNLNLKLKNDTQRSVDLSPLALQGAKGDKGDKGDQGTQGVPGADGAQGAKGDKGDQGTQGVPGADGAQGLKGDKGDDASAGYAVTVVSSNTNATIGQVYVFTSNVTLTLPSSPTAGEWVEVSNMSAIPSPVVAGNGNRIMGVEENLTMDRPYIGFRLVYVNSTLGWIIIGQ